MIRKYALRMVVGLILLIIFSAAALWMITYFAFRDFKWLDDTGCVDNSSHEQIEAFAHFEFPVDAENIEVFSEQSWNDCFIYISFQMPASESELDELIASTYIDKLVKSRPPSLFSPMPHNLDWSFSKDNSYWSGEGREQVVHQVVVLKFPAQYTVYFIIGMF